MRGCYSATYKATAVDSARTLIALASPSGKLVKIIGASVTAPGATANQQLECKLQRITAVGSLSGTSVTPGSTEAGDQAAASTVTANASAEPTYAADGIDEHGYMAFPSQGGYFADFDDETAPYVANGELIGLRLLTTPTSTDLVITLSFKEMG